uniref:cAMP responsive element binding protein 1 n=1 Tax=Eptatretus burgeri TaxID=7764 RepID=A0A8C4Q1N1_EPTBU
MSNETESRENGTATVTVNTPAVTNTQPGQLHLHATQVSGTPGVSVVQIPGGQTIEVQSVIQTQPSVIQTPTIQTVQVAAIADTEDSEGSVEAVSDTKKRREILSRRPSYRKIFNELSSDPPSVSRIDEEKSEEEGSGQTISTTTLPSIYQTSTGQYIAIAPGGAVQLASASAGENVLGLQGLSVGGGQTSTPTFVQYAQTSDGQQLLLPANQVVVQGMQIHHFMSRNCLSTLLSPALLSCTFFFFLAASGEVQTYQIRTASGGVPQGVVVATASPTGVAPVEEASRKRELRLYKNREAARECRRKKKEYVKCLENRVAVLENQNKTLIEELKALKDLYCPKAE